MAGTGKSTIARTIARNFDEEKRLGASFFFSKGQGDPGGAKKFFTTLAAQLASNVPELRQHICKAIDDNPDIAEQGLGEQWRKLILQPVSQLQTQNKSFQHKTLVLVIDAMDECEDERHIKLIPQLISQATTLRSVKLRAFVTGRPETADRCGFTSGSTSKHMEEFILHHIDLEIVSNDIYTYLEYELKDVLNKNFLPSGWPGKDKISSLCNLAGKLFIYASTAVRFIRDEDPPDPEEQLSIILTKWSGGSSPRISELDKMYTGILQSPLPPENPEKFISDVRHIVGAIVVLFETFSPAGLAALLSIPEQTVRHRLRCLNSVIDISKPQERGHTEGKKLTQAVNIGTGIFRMQLYGVNFRIDNRTSVDVRGFGGVINLHLSMQFVLGILALCDLATRAAK